MKTGKNIINLSDTPTGEAVKMAELSEPICVSVERILSEKQPRSAEIVDTIAVEYLESVIDGRLISDREMMLLEKICDLIDARSYTQVSNSTF